MNQRNHGIDFFKLIAAFFIILTHVKYGNLNSDIVNSLRLSARWGSPYFFMVSGYFLQRKIASEGIIHFASIKKYLSQLISIYIIANLIYITLEALKGNYHTELDVIFTGASGHLWFVSALIFGYIVLWYIYEKSWQQYLPFISIAILGLSLIFNAYDKVLHKNLDSEMSRYLLCIPFMYFGMIIKRTSIKHIYPGVLFLLLGIILQYTEAYYLEKYYALDLYEVERLAGSVLITIGIFLIAERSSIGDNIISRWSRKYSLFIYLYHTLVYAMWNYALDIFELNANFFKVISPVVAFSGTLLFAICIDRLIPGMFRLLNGTFSQKTSEEKA